MPVLYQPGIPHEVLSKDPDKYGVYRIRIDDVVVRYVEDTHSVQVTVEGDLPAEAIEHIRDDLIEKLEVLEQSPIEHRVIPHA